MSTQIRASGCHTQAHHNKRKGSPPFFSPASGQVIHRQEARRGRGVTVRSPVIDELLHSVSDAQGALQGRRLTAREEALARTVFGNSIDYSRVRILTTGVAPGTTPGNTIRLPANFSIEDYRGTSDPSTGERPLNQEHAQLLIHEMTHVWQFQHSGPGYVTTSLGQQIAASITRGNRNFAYAYTLQSGDSFFDFGPEQQAHIVENYYAMRRDLQFLNNRAPGVRYLSNHLGPDGFHVQLTPEARRQEIDTELPLHEPLIQQMRRAIPPSESQLLEIRRRSLMMTPLPGSDRLPPTPRDLTPSPAVTVFEIRFP